MTRPDQLLKGVEQTYSRMWDAVSSFLDSRDEMGDWPEWCFLPMAGSYAIVSGGGSNRITSTPDMLEMQLMAAVIPWRMTKGLYRFDPTLLNELWQTPVDKELPIEVLFRLPEWCIYVDAQGQELFGAAMHGFFAYLEYDVNARRVEFRLFLDFVDMPLPDILHLDHARCTCSYIGRI